VADWCSPNVTKYQGLRPLRNKSRVRARKVGGTDAFEPIRRLIKHTKKGVNNMIIAFNTAKLAPSDKRELSKRLAEIAAWSKKNAQNINKDAEMYEENQEIYNEIKKWEEGAAELAKELSGQIRKLKLQSVES
jgi:uncharacterized coiled-coil DUF342 family protein